MNELRLEQVSFAYEQGLPRVIKKVSLEIQKGEIILLMGPTGSGKSTLLQIMAGVSPYTTGGEISGKVYVSEKNILDSPKSTEFCRGRVGLVLQDPETQLINLTVRDEVSFGPENLLLSREEILTRVDWAIKHTRLESQENSFVYALSGGQKQRIAIASGLAMKPQIFLLDAPLTNLDPAGQEEVLSTISHLIDSGMTSSAVIASNKIDVLLPLATRIIVMDKGEIILDSDPETILYKNQSTLKKLGIFIPEVSLLWPIIREFNNNNSPLPRTTGEFGKKISPFQPFVEVKSFDFNINLSDNVAEASNIHFDYGGQPVLEGVNFHIKQGEFLAILGQNGSGKSTLANIICGLRKPKKGDIEIMGKNTKKTSPQNVVGYVFQYPEHQFVSSTIKDELCWGLEEILPEKEIKTRMQHILKLIDMTDKVDESPYILSVGEKRMLSVATMLMRRPKILILDEPTTGLDHRLTENLMQILKTFVTKHSMTVVQISHDMEQVAQHCDRVIVIDKGKVIFEGSPKELFYNEQVLRQAKLEATPVCEISKTLFPESARAPITVKQFLKEVNYARTRIFER